MSVQPVSIASVRGVSNNVINFEGRKDRKDYKPSGVRASVMAVPLATLLAMSPLNAQAARKFEMYAEPMARIENVDMASKEELPEGMARISMNNGAKELFSLRENDGKTYFMEFHSANRDGNIQKISISVKDNDDMFNAAYGDDVPEAEKHTVSGFRKVYFDIHGDDGDSNIKVNLDQLVVDDSNIGCSSDKLIKVLKKFMLGELSGLRNDGAIKMAPPVRAKLSVNSINSLRNGFNASNLLKESPYTADDFGEPLYKANLETKHGDYELVAYSKDEDAGDYEIITVQKEGEPLFRVAALDYATINLSDNAKIGDFKLPIVELYTGKGDRRAKVLDSKLFEELWKVADDVRCNKAFERKASNQDMLLMGNGIVSNIK